MKVLAIGEGWGAAADSGFELVREPEPDVVAVLTLPAYPVRRELIDALPTPRTRAASPW